MFRGRACCLATSSLKLVDKHKLCTRRAAQLTRKDEPLHKQAKQVALRSETDGQAALSVEI